MKKFVSILLSFMLILTLAACGNTPPAQDGDILIDQIVTTIQEVYGEHYLPSESLDQESFNTITGLTSDQYDEFMAQVPMMSTQADELFVIKTKNVDEVKGIMEDYQTYLRQGAMQYPMNMNKVAHSVLYTADEYVIFFILGGYVDVDADTMDEEAFNIAEGEYLDKMNTACIAALDELFSA